MSICFNIFFIYTYVYIFVYIYIHISSPQGRRTKSCPKSLTEKNRKQTSNVKQNATITTSVQLQPSPKMNKSATTAHKAPHSPSRHTRSLCGIENSSTAYRPTVTSVHAILARPCALNAYN